MPHKGWRQVFVFPYQSGKRLLKANLFNPQSILNMEEENEKVYNHQARVLKDRDRIFSR
jgi:hypothetical protein